MPDKPIIGQDSDKLTKGQKHFKVFGLIILGFLIKRKNLIFGVILLALIVAGMLVYFTVN